MQQMFEIVMRLVPGTKNRMDDLKNRSVASSYYEGYYQQVYNATEMNSSYNHYWKTKTVYSLLPNTSGS